MPLPKRKESSVETVIKKRYYYFNSAKVFGDWYFTLGSFSVKCFSVNEVVPAQMQVNTYLYCICLFVSV